MNVPAMNNLWHYISGLSLTAKNKQWLSQKLLESTRREKASSKADEALRKLDGCWACEDIDDSLERDVLSIRSHEARAVELMDEQL
jgi:hypothetical protein